MKLYKYSKYQKQIFSEFLFRFSTIRQLNDPFESSINYVDFEQVVRKSPFEGMDDLLKQVREGGHDTSQCVFSLSRVKDNLPMWSHYANNHKGIVVEFNGDHSFFNQEFDIGGERQISKVKPIFYNKNKFKIFDMMERMSPTFYKSTDWIYEQEYRFVLTKTLAHTIVRRQGEEDIFLFKIPPKAVTKIIFGANIDEMIVEEARKLLSLTNPSETKHIVIERAYMDNEHYLLNFKKLS